MYKENNIKLVHIPYFIQLTNQAVETLFNVKVITPLFAFNVPSLVIEDRCTPAFLCPMGIKRMKEEFKLFPDQYELNLNYLKSLDNDELSGYSLLK